MEKIIHRQKCCASETMSPASDLTELADSCFSFSSASSVSVLLRSKRNVGWKIDLFMMFHVFSSTSVPEVVSVSNLIEVEKSPCEKNRQTSSRSLEQLSAILFRYRLFLGKTSLKSTNWSPGMSYTAGCIARASLSLTKLPSLSQTTTVS